MSVFPNPSPAGSLPCPILEARHLVKSFAVEGGILRRRVGEVRAVEDVSLTLSPGEVVALVGESGSGKTTVGKLLVGLFAPEEGTVLLNGEPASSFPHRRRAGFIQMIFQDPFASLNPKLPVGTILAEAVRVRRSLREHPAAGSVTQEVQDLLELVGLPRHCRDEYPHQFSGGQRQRLGIARALALGPQVLIADEPVSALDLSIQAQILNLLLDLKAQHHLSYLVIAHDLAVVDFLADRVLVMQAGRIVEQGPTATVLTHPQHPYTQRLLDAVPPAPPRP